MSGRRLIVTTQARTMTVAFLLLCVLNFWTLQVSSSQDPLHRHHVHDLTTRESNESPSSPSPNNNKRQASLVNQHALLQVQVSIECDLEEQQDLLKHDNDKNSSSVFRSSNNDVMLMHSTSWFVMITELPPSNSHEMDNGDSLHLDQAVDLNSWTRVENSASLYTTISSLSFLIPLSSTTTMERTLILSLMEHDDMGNSRIASRRLANLPILMNSGSVSTNSNNKRSSAVVNVELSTRTTCTLPKRLGETDSSFVQGSNKTIGMFLVVLLGVVLVVYFYPNKPREATTTTSTTTTTREEGNEHVSTQQQQQVETRVRVKRTIVIDSPGSSNDSSTCSSTLEHSSDQDDLQDSSNHHRRNKSHIIKPPSLVRIPYSFAAEHESEEESSISVESCTVPQQQQEQQDAIRQNYDAFPSPVVDVKKDARDSVMKDHETENGTTAMVPEESQGPRNLAEQQNTVDVVDMAETQVVQDTAVADADVMEMAEAAMDSNKTSLSGEQDASDSPVDETTETELVRQDEMPVQPPPEGASDATETATTLVAQSTTAPPTQQQGGNGSDHMSSSSGNSTDGQQDSDEVVNAAASVADISKVADTSQGTSATQPINNVNASPSENVQPSEVVDTSNGSADYESKVQSPPSETVQTLESTGDGQDSQDFSNATNKDRDSVQASVEEESSETVNERLVVQRPDQALDTNDVIPNGNDNDESSLHNDDQQPASRHRLESKVIDVEYIPMDESNWLKRLRERPSAVASSTVGQNDALVVATATNSAAQKESKEPERDELSYSSTLPPDSFGGDDFSVDDTALMPQGHAGTGHAEEVQVAAAVNTDAQDMTRPQRKKRRLPPLKSRYRSDQDSDALQQHAALPDKTRSRKQAPRNTTTELAAALAPQATATTKPADGAPTKPRPKKPPTDTIVPDVVPSVLLKAASKQVTDVPFDFSKAAASSTSTRARRKQQRSRRRKRKGPPSLIILLDENDDSPVPPQHSVVSRGSSRVPKKKQGEAGEGKTSFTESSGKRRRLKK